MNALRGPSTGQVLADSFSKAFVPSFTGALQKKLEEHHENEKYKQDADQAGRFIEEYEKLGDQATPQAGLMLAKKLGTSQGGYKLATQAIQQNTENKIAQQKQKDLTRNYLLNRPDIKASSESYNDYLKTGKSANTTLSNVAELDKLIDLGAGKDWQSRYGAVLGEGKFRNYLLGNESDASAAFNTVSKNFISDFKKTFGARITDADLAFIDSAVPSLKRTPKQNKAILSTYSAIAKKYQQQAKIARTIVSQNEGIPPPNLDELVQTQMQPYEEEINRLKEDVIHTEEDYVEFNGKKYYGSPERLSEARKMIEEEEKKQRGGR